MASMYMINQVAKRRPDARIAVGGPEAFNSWFLTKMRDEFNTELKKLKESGQYTKIMNSYFERAALKSEKR